MWIFYTALSLFILLTAYFFAFPLSKKRPVLIKRGGLIAYGVVLAATLYPWPDIKPLFVVVIAAIILLLIFKAWFVYGLTDILISDALSKAASATRTSIGRSGGSYRIDNSLRIRIRKIAGKVNIVSFKKGGESKKAKLTAVVFKKFIQNYFV